MSFMLLTWGRSWPGGLEGGRFNWLPLPASAADIREHVAFAKNVDEDEATCLRGWRESGYGSGPRSGGIDACVVIAPENTKTSAEFAAVAESASLSALAFFENLGCGDAFVVQLAQVMGPIVVARALPSR